MKKGRMGGWEGEGEIMGTLAHAAWSLNLDWFLRR